MPNESENAASSWPVETLGEVASRVAGRYDPDKGDEPKRWLAANHIDEMDLQVHRSGEPNDPLFPPTFRFTFESGDVLIHSRNPDKVVIAEFDGITGEKLFVLRSRDETVLRTDFLAFILQSSFFRNWVIGRLSGSVNKFLNWTALDKFEFPLPPICEQDRILSLLWAAERCRRAYLRAASKAQALRDACLLEFFGPRHRDSRSREIQKVPLAKGWRLVEASSLSNAPITKGETPRGEVTSEVGDIPFVKIYNLNFDGVLDFSIKPSFVSSKAHSGKLKRSQVLPGDLLMNLVGPPLGKIGIVTDEYPEWNINQAIARYRPSTEIAGRFLWYYLQSDWAQGWLFRRSKKTSGQRNLTLKLAQQLPVPLPDKVQMSDIVKRLDELVVVRSNVEKMLLMSIDLQKSLSDNRFGGGA